ncbi:reactive intermediate/imine deaminase [Clostridiaceae bacterium 14S0207]|nr:reactive intermediate/imine deaminase [Clostridiaceae bacterium 14S0207]
MKKVIQSEFAPAAIGPYVQAVEVNGLLYTSGQLGIDKATGKLEESIQKQAKQVMKNLEYILKEAGCTFKDVVKTTIFLENIKDFATVNEIYGSYFEGVYPARSAFQIGKLPLGAKIEIELLAALPR